MMSLSWLVPKVAHVLHLPLNCLFPVNLVTSILNSRDGESRTPRKEGSHLTLSLTIDLLCQDNILESQNSCLCREREVLSKSSISPFGTIKTKMDGAFIQEQWREHIPPSPSQSIVQKRTDLEQR